MGWVFAGLAVVVVAALVVLGLMFARERTEASREKAAAAKAFEQAVRRRLSKGFDGFSLTAFAEEAGIPRQTAQAVGDDLYGVMVKKAYADGKVTAKERATLDRLGDALAVSPETRKRVEEYAAQGVFQEKASVALADGRLSEAEAAELDELRHGLGLSKGQVHALAGADAESSYVAQFRQMLHRGRISQRVIDELATLRQTFGIPEARGFELIRQDAENTYREYFTSAKQDGEVDDQEEHNLDRLQRLLGLPDSSVAPYKRELAQLRRLADYRKGHLPSVQTRKYLEGGEICHFDEPCQHFWETTTKMQRAEGELTITSQRVIFTSGVRSHEFRPSKIADLRLHGDGIYITVTSGRGTGGYYLKSPEEAEAILSALTRKQKYVAVEGFSATATRHIPATVKQEVWARDGGKCAQCSATDYLEFDHIIPHSRGGSNGVNNVQVLCRRCNGMKSDRI